MGTFLFLFISAETFIKIPNAKAIPRWRFSRREIPKKNFLFDNFFASHLQFHCFVGKRNFLGFVENNLVKRRSISVDPSGV